MKTKRLRHHALCSRHGPNNGFQLDRNNALASRFHLQCVPPVTPMQSPDSQFASLERHPTAYYGDVHIKDLVDMITPDLPARCRSFDLSRHNPSWKLITASFLDASRATFMYKLARGCLPIQYRPFTARPARGVCPFCGAREDAVHIFSQCALPAALHRKIASLFNVPGIPYQTVRFLSPLPSRAINQFVLLLVECSYQVGWHAGTRSSTVGGRGFPKCLQKYGRSSGSTSPANGTSWAGRISRNLASPGSYIQGVRRYDYGDF
ncbi:hypothetical protein HPB50_016268 [Hyalomma asiaticum]|uniref:Uncharacterized protein n=1 Tax=Hyalomma asiaticum TaxID=266040 RepID=A0ACB7TLK8_HYAAI|nr:hypothetical protein HPB50_016268 [Hyalomma asiaticum]